MRSRLVGLLGVFVIVLAVFTTGIVDTPVSEAPAAEATTSAPCYAMGHWDTTWWSHGVKHLGDYYYHEPWADYYRVYHLVQSYAGGPWYWSFQGNASCWGWH